MPKVPTYNGPQIQQGQLPSVGLNVQPADASVVGRAFSKLGSDLGDVFQAEKRRAIDASLNNAWAAAQNETTKALYGYKKQGPDDPNDDRVGLVQLEGGDLFSQAGKIRESYQQSISKIENQLSTDEAKRQFQKSKLSFLSEFDRHVQQRISVQREKTNALSYETLNDTAINSLSSGLLADYQGTLPGGDLSPVHDLMDRLAITSNQFANDPLNQSPYENRSEWSRQLSLKAQGKALQELLPQIVKNDPMGARLLAERYADALPNKAQTMSAIEHSEVSKRAEDAASEALVIGAAKSGGFNALGLPNGSLAEQETEALNHIRGLDVPQNIKDAALNRVQARFDENRRIEKQWNEETMSGFFSKMQTGEISTLDQVQKDTLFWKMQPEYRERVVKAFDTDAKKSRPEVLAILNQNAYTENERDRDMFANTDLAKRQIALPYIDSNGERSIKTMVLTDSEFKEAIQLQNEIKKAKQSEQERINMDGKRSVHSIAEDKAKLLKLNPEQKDFFHKRLLENVLVEETKGKKRLNAVQIEELASQLVTKVYEKSWLPDSSLRVFEIPRTKPLSENQYVPIKNIPENKIMEIKALFKKSQGKEPTDPQIELEYAKELFNRQQELNPANRTDIPFLK